MEEERQKFISKSAQISSVMTITVSPAELKNLEDTLLNTQGNVLLHNRFRALFTLKSLKSEEAIRIISDGGCLFDVMLHSH